MNYEYRIQGLSMGIHHLYTLHAYDPRVCTTSRCKFSLYEFPVILTKMVSLLSPPLHIH